MIASYLLSLIFVSGPPLFSNSGELIETPLGIAEVGEGYRIDPHFATAGNWSVYWPRNGSLEFINKSLDLLIYITPDGKISFDHPTVKWVRASFHLDDGRTLLVGGRHDPASGEIFEDLLSWPGQVEATFVGDQVRRKIGVNAGLDICSKIGSWRLRMRADGRAPFWLDPKFLPWAKLKENSVFEAKVKRPLYEKGSLADGTEYISYAPDGVIFGSKEDQIISLRLGNKSHMELIESGVVVVFRPAKKPYFLVSGSRRISISTDGYKPIILDHKKATNSEFFLGGKLVRGHEFSNRISRKALNILSSGKPVYISGPSEELVYRPQPLKEAIEFASVYIPRVDFRRE